MCNFIANLSSWTDLLFSICIFEFLFVSLVPLSYSVFVWLYPLALYKQYNEPPKVFFFKYILKLLLFF